MDAPVFELERALHRPLAVLALLAPVEGGGLAVGVREVAEPGLQGFLLADVNSLPFPSHTTSLSSPTPANSLPLSPFFFCLHSLCVCVASVSRGCESALFVAVLAA